MLKIDYISKVSGYDKSVGFWLGCCHGIAFYVFGNTIINVMTTAEDVRSSKL